VKGEIQKVLLHQTCIASGDIHNCEEIDKCPGQSLESSIEVRIAKPLDLTCPHVDCKDTERVIYTKKTNLLRHYQRNILDMDFMTLEQEPSQSTPCNSTPPSLLPSSHAQLK
jgi:hypothetical protein